MRKKTIGEVLRLARINQGLSIEEHMLGRLNWTSESFWMPMIREA